MTEQEFEQFCMFVPLRTTQVKRKRNKVAYAARPVLARFPWTTQLGSTREAARRNFFRKHAKEVRQVVIAAKVKQKLRGKHNDTTN